ncbi:MAG: proline--tRNA ligase, partial [Propionibacteriaceae bacterium]|nr:proline--tRNA ligase [Propionibacteriaceae bacterium]
MIQTMSSLFTKTLRQDPADAEFPSHKLLVRGGYIRRAAPGVYTWLPLGLAVVAKIEAIVREEMNAIGAQEVRFPVLLPSEPYKATNRWVEYGENLFRLQDRRENDMLLGPTHEEMFTLLVKDMCTSYKDLPLHLYQIQTKFRDEARPRAGLIRCREFIMKDSYTFDIDEAGLKAQYADIRGAYQRVFDRLGFRYVIVAADAGAMGGSKSEEFQAISPNGEDTFVFSDGGYAANVEAVVTPTPASIDYANAPAAHVEDTPDVPTIDTLVALSNERFPRGDGRDWTGTDTLKNIAYWVKHLDETRTPLIIGLPGDREIDEKRLAVALAPATAEPMISEDFAGAKGIAGVLARGYIGPAKDGAQFLGETAPSGVRYLLDPRVVPGTRWITGANEPGHHT